MRRRRTKLLGLAVAAVGFGVSMSSMRADVPRVLEPGKLPADKRLAVRTTNDAAHPWAPPTTLPAWEAVKTRIREQMLVGMGLWPMPPMAPLNPVIHGKIERDDYTIEKVFFASHPGHYVSGNLYRPKNVQGKVPGVLFPHGHWANGRMYELAADKARSDEIAGGGEKFLAGAQYPLQALPVGLARMGCVVFHYDMVGVADSQKIPHAAGFSDLDATLKLQDAMGLQTVNSIQALNFLTSLPDVDTTRIGVTGASGGGTQTFVLCAVDPRPTVAFPAVMVSTAMQGGCVCENCSYLRLGVNNIAMTALFAPKPLAMSGANDWTIDIQNSGLPELKAIYGLYHKSDLVHAKTLARFGHNYNQVSREMMYAWFNKYLSVGAKEPVEERDFQPVPPKELSVYDAAHPLPLDALDATGLRAHLTLVANDQLAALLPKNVEAFQEYRRIIGTAARIMLDAGVPAPDEVNAAGPLHAEQTATGVRMFRITATRRDAGEQIPILALLPQNFGGDVVLWFDGAGKQHLFDAAGNPKAAVQKLLDAARGVISADLFQTGEFLTDPSKPLTAQAVNSGFPGYTFGYNRPLLSNRVRDILTVIGGVRKFANFKTVHLVGTGEAGPWVGLARGLADDRIARCLADLRGFGFSKIQQMSDPMLLPGALKYGGIGWLAALAAPHELALYGTEGVPADEMNGLNVVYKLTPEKLTTTATPLTDEIVAEQILK
ncbi:MAG: acetylxylan esterase [Planctomycetia bacterium]|nr:acetylxylan esterase [Planctomycetia bacterium]